MEYSESEEDIESEDIESMSEDERTEKEGMTQSYKNRLFKLFSNIIREKELNVEKICELFNYFSISGSNGIFRLTKNPLTDFPFPVEREIGEGFNKDLILKAIRLSHNTIYADLHEWFVHYTLMRIIQPNPSNTPLNIVRLYHMELCTTKPLTQQNLPNFLKNTDLLMIIEQKGDIVIEEFLENAENARNFYGNTNDLFFSIIGQILCSLHQLQVLCDFVHGDLNIGNIVLNINNDNKLIVSNILNKKFIFNSTYIVKFIDFEYASITVENESIGRSLSEYKEFMKDIYDITTELYISLLKSLHRKEIAVSDVATNVLDFFAMVLRPNEDTIKVFFDDNYETIRPSLELIDKMKNRESIEEGSFQKAYDAQEEINLGVYPDMGLTEFWDITPKKLLLSPLFDNNRKDKNFLMNVYHVLDITIPAYTAKINQIPTPIEHNSYLHKISIKSLKNFLITIGKDYKVTVLYKDNLKPFCDFKFTLEQFQKIFL